MNYIHIIASIDLSLGGPSKSVSDLAIRQATQGLKTILFTNSSPNPYMEKSPINNLDIQFIKNKSFKQALRELLFNTQVNLMHGHGIWQMPVHYMSKLALRKHIPYIITPRGMLEPWALNTKSWKKKLALLLYQKKDLANAACLHATAQMEAENLRNLGFENPIAIIPNGIDISEFPLPQLAKSKNKKTLLFLSRIHPKKGIEMLIKVWEKIDNSIKNNWIVEIAGNGDESYINSIQEIIASKDLLNEIKIIGPQFGNSKIETYHRADLFVLPTYSENFGIVIAEALAYGIPVITTKGTPWEELNTYKAGWWIEIGIEPLKQTLEVAMQINDAERQSMGQNGRKLVEEKYSIESVAKQMIQLYDWVLGKIDKPSFVYLKETKISII